MWQLLNGETGILIRSGYVYVPLLFDREVEAELKVPVGAGVLPPPGGVETKTDDVLLYADGGYFVKSLSLHSLVENYPVVFPEECERERQHLREKVFHGISACGPLLDTRLKTIILEIIPQFLRPRRTRRPFNNREGGVLANLAAKLPMGRGWTVLTERLQEQKTSLQQVLLRLEHLDRPPAPPPEQHRPGRELAVWFQEAVQWNLVGQEIRHWQRELTEVQDLLDLPKPELAVLLDIAARGAVEVDGCGCCPDKRYPGEYLVYKRTGEFVLQDYFGRFYLFPDCRVGVSTAGPFHPMVLDTYKHPLLRGFGSRQKICLTDYQPALEFSAKAVIRALEEGLNALYYGYNSRKRNGYNSLDSFGRHLSVIDFEDLRLPREDPRLINGEVEVKNSSL
jgi:hypothetical protein